MADPSQDVVVVSGLPRSGTSMMMQMIVEAGVAPLTDLQREADEDNPRGYFELEAVKTTKSDQSWLAAAPGKVVKVIHILLKDLPPTYSYRIVMMLRDMDEVVASQKKMLDRSGKAGAAMSGDALKRVFATQLDGVRRWISSQPNCTVLDVRYDEVIADPAGQAKRVAEFIGRPDRAQAMSAGVQASLYRNRKPGNP